MSLVVESSKDLKSSAMNSIAESTRQVEDVLEFEEIHLAARDNLGDDRGVNDKLDKFSYFGTFKEVQETL